MNRSRSKSLSIQLFAQAPNSFQSEKETVLNEYIVKPKLILIFKSNVACQLSRMITLTICYFVIPVFETVRSTMSHLWFQSVVSIHSTVSKKCCQTDLHKYFKSWLYRILSVSITEKSMDFIYDYQLLFSNIIYKPY